MTDSLILAGGKSVRFKSDKALAHFNDTIIPNVKYTADLTLPYVDNCYISTNANNDSKISDLFNDSKIKVIKDQPPMIDCGPLSALWAYFQYIKNSDKQATSNAELLVVATDYVIDQKAINFLNQQVGYIKIKNLPYYTCCHLTISMDLLERQIQNDNYRWRSLLKATDCGALEYDGTLKNINYPEDLI